MSRNKQRGTAFETLVKTWLCEQGFDADRQILTGKNDLGDIKVYGVPIAFELKNHKTMDLSGWLKEAHVEAKNGEREMGVVVHKRRGKGVGGEQYVTLTLEDFMVLVRRTYLE